MFLYTNMGMGWEWEYGYGNWREWDRKSHSRTSLMCIRDDNMSVVLYYVYIRNDNKPVVSFMFLSSIAVFV